MYCQYLDSVNHEIWKTLKSYEIRIVLLSKHPLVFRLIYYYYTKTSHTGIQGMKSIIREKFWILGGRKTFVWFVERTMFKILIHIQCLYRDIELGMLQFSKLSVVWLCIITRAVYRVSIWNWMLLYLLTVSYNRFEHL